jgi:hypothetical protein
MLKLTNAYRKSVAAKVGHKNIMTSKLNGADQDKLRLPGRAEPRDWAADE